MKKVLLGGVALITLGFVGSAVAADMPIKAPVVVSNSWTGVYVGIDAGGVRGDVQDGRVQGGFAAHKVHELVAVVEPELLQCPDRVIGMHFFNPPQVLPLVEIVSGKSTDPVVAKNQSARADRWKHQQGRGYPRLPLAPPQP